MKEAIRQKKVAYKKKGENRSEENMTKYKNMKNLAKITVANSMSKEAEKVFTKSNKKSSNIFTLVKFKRKDRKGVEGRCMRGKT